MDAPAAARIMTPHLVQRDFLSGVEQAALLAWALGNEARFAPAGVGGVGVNAAVRRSVSLRDLGVVSKKVVHPLPGCEAGDAGVRSREVVVVDPGGSGVAALLG